MVGLIFYSIMLFIALAIYRVTVALLAAIGLPPEVVVVLDVLFRLFAVLALIAACVVILLQRRGVQLHIAAWP